MNQSPELDKLAAALAKAQGSLNAAKKDAENPHFKNRYATLQSVWEAAKEVLSPNGLSVIQTFSESDGRVMHIRTTLLHSSGQWIAGVLSMSPQQANPQGIASAITYGRRYALSSIVGIVADDDDDGNNASKGHADNAITPTSVKPKQKADAKGAGAKKVTPLGSEVPWRDFAIHFGKNKGVFLGQLETDNFDALVWYCREWMGPKNGQPTEQDVALRSALDRAMAEFKIPRVVNTDDRIEGDPR